MDEKTLSYAALAIGKQYPFIQKDQGGRVWEPHLNDGDAFRLGHELRLFTDVPVWPLKIEDMRRAIVRAAAEIGRTLWIPNTQTEDGCPIDTSQLVFVIYENDDIDSGIAGDWHEIWNTTRELYIKGYRIINDY